MPFLPIKHRIQVVALAAMLIQPSLAFAESGGTILDDWSQVTAPPAPKAEAVSVDPKTTALLMLDFMATNCTQAQRPRCVASIPAAKKLLDWAHAKGLLVVYSLPGALKMSDFVPELAAKGDEPVVSASADKFLRTNLDDILKSKGIKTVITAGVVANGAVLYTATGAAYRGYNVIVPADAIAGETLYSEQLAVWQLLNGPGLAGKVKLSDADLIQ